MHLAVYHAPLVDKAGTHAALLADLKVKRAGLKTKINACAHHRTALTTTGIAHIALRLNHTVNLTTPPDSVRDAHVQTTLHRQLNRVTGLMEDVVSDAHISGGHTTTTATRNSLTFATHKSAMHDEKYVFPMYLTSRWLHGSTLRADLDHGVKMIDCIKLMGYSLANKRHVGLNATHEAFNDDYLIMRINEINGHVVSNNRHANGAFAVLPFGSHTAASSVGSVEYENFDTNGIVVQSLDASSAVIRNLTLQLTDRVGEPAHFGRLHLWFKLLVAHG